MTVHKTNSINQKVYVPSVYPPNLVEKCFMVF